MNAPLTESRTILHVDMDAFFVACEVRRNPELAGKAVIVGGTGNRGVVAAASYEARRFGVRSAMPSTRARRLCPHAIVLPGDHELYAEVSREVHDVFHSVTPIVEPISLDEAFLDVSGARRLLGGGRAIAELIRQRIDERLGLACSVGVAPNKFLAKLASEAAKPTATPHRVLAGHGVVVVSPGEELAFLHPLPVQAMWGVGPVTLERLRRLGVTSVGELAALPVDAIVASVGRAAGAHLAALARGVDDRPVVAERDTKSIGHEETFAHDMHERAEIDREVVRLADAVASRLRANGLAGRTVTMKVRFGDFHTITRSVTLADHADTGPVLIAAARGVLETVDPAPGVRLLGLSVSALSAHPSRQLSLDGVAVEPGGTEWDDASRTVDEIRRRFGDRSIGPAALVHDATLRTLRRGAQQWGPNDEG